MISNITQNWGLMRIIRLLIGGYAIFEALKSHDLMVGILGLIIASMALLNVGCGAQGCGIPISKNTKKEDPTHEDVEYEEVHSK